MRDVETTLAEMREFLPVASKDDEQRVRDLTERDIKRTLRDVRIPTSSSVESSRSGRSSAPTTNGCRCSRRSLRG